MKLLTVQFRSYNYEELSEKAKEKAYSTWFCHNDGDAWDSDYRGILETLEDRFGCHVRTWDVGLGNYSFRISCDNPETFSSPVRLAKFIIKRSGIESFAALDNCPFSGFCGDFGATDVIKKAFTFSLAYADYETFLREMFDSFFAEWAKDRESQVSREYFEENCASDAQYSEDGRVLLYEDGRVY